MAGIPKEHEKLYFDVLCRTQKLETVLSLIHATYQAKKSGVADIKTEIAKRLENAYNLFKTNIRGTNSGSGTYSGTIKQFESQYTIGHELCIWSNSNLDLTSYALAVAKGEMSIKEYFDIFFLSYFQPINGKVVHVLYLILKYLIDNNVDFLEKENIPVALGVDAEKEDINALCNFLSDTTYIEYKDKKLFYVGKENIKAFIKRCNTRYVGDGGLALAKAELDTDEKYSKYVMSGHVACRDNQPNIEYSLTIAELGSILKEMYDGGAKIVGIHLFGIRYGKYIRKMGFSVPDIIKASGIKESYFAEVNKGISLSSYVKEVVDATGESSPEENDEYEEVDYEKFKNLLAWFAKQLNINNGIETGVKTSGQGYKDNSSIRELYKDWRDYGSFTLDCNLVGGFQGTFSKVNYINKTRTGINIRPNFNKTTKEIINFYIDIYENTNKEFTDEISNILQKEYKIDDLSLFDGLEPNDNVKEFFNDYITVIIYFSENKSADYDNCVREKNGTNVILYGVPGAGKSWTIKHEYCDANTVMERVVFHPDYTYSDFVGQILPKVDENGTVTYSFTPGPFTTILRDAYKTPNKKFFLVIEEVNRGNAPAIFGDIFQLLDRTVDGNSEYDITNSDIASVVYGDENHKVSIPSNLSILCTMNTSDQNVFTLDTAFQRRWNMRLIQNKFRDGEENEQKFAKTRILDTDVTWEKFFTEINKIILEKNIRMTSSEDKRLGTHFVSPEDLVYAENNYKQNSRFPEKVLKYLWDDAFKFTKEDVFDLEKVKSLEDVIELFLSSKGNERFRVFKENIFNTIVIKPVSEQKTADVN